MNCEFKLDEDWIEGTVQAPRPILQTEIVIKPRDHSNRKRYVVVYRRFDAPTQELVGDDVYVDCHNGNSLAPSSSGADREIER